MSIDRITEALAAHADQLNSGKPDMDAEILADLPDERDDVASLMAVAARVKRTLKPVKPKPAFRTALHDGLMMAAHHQQTHQILIEKREDPQWRWLLGAAAIGSAAGLLAVVLRSRAQDHRAMVMAPSGKPAETHMAVQ